ncbi:MAG TPA: hypothetical protein VFP05_11005 [Thermomicrobiales bacterium]|nr:hypothetical protein [Thermomicrobiales bacterium]
MDDRRFDSLVKSLATGGTSRRALFKGLLGLGGAAAVGGTVLEGTADAARRPTPTPTPVRCPGNQTPVGGVCTCPAGLSQCNPGGGPACCNDDVPRVLPTGQNNPDYSECCDNACCDGKCYGEELCCPYTQTWCEATQECCPVDLPYCCGDGCCATPCCDTTAGSVCCLGETPKCCPGDVCIPESGCCVDEDCPGCQSCSDAHICVDDRTNCPGGEAGCDDCVSAECVANNQRCDDGNTCTDDICDAATGQCSHPFDCNGDSACCTGGSVCTNHTCLGDGTCDYSPNCNGLNSCCDDGDACTQNICNEGGGCSYPFYCTSNDCCAGSPSGPACDLTTGTCYNPCEDTPFESCASTPCCDPLRCFSILESPPICIPCIPSFVEGVPVPCLGFCDFCCSGKSYLGFCVDCGLQFSSCQADPNSCCDGFYCQYSPITDNFCTFEI